MALSYGRCAQEPADIEPLSIVTATAATLFNAEVADTDELRSRGLMFRHRLPEDRAMLFDFGDSAPAAMWMKNTYISLDMLFVRATAPSRPLLKTPNPSHCKPSACRSR